MRPWQNPCPPIQKTEDLLIKYPSDDENNGIFSASWRGPSAVEDQYTLMSCSILLKYLTDFSVSPMQREFVEINDPYASKVNFTGNYSILIYCKLLNELITDFFYYARLSIVYVRILYPVYILSSKTYRKQNYL